MGPASPVRIWVIGLGMVGRWFLEALDSRRDWLAERYGVAPTVVGLANAHDGFIYAERGLDIGAVLHLTSEGGSITGYRDVIRFPTAIDGLRATEADVLVEVSASPATDGEPGHSHMREALGRGIPVATSNKWPVALHGVELAELARSNRVSFRAESTVMSGTPTLGPLTDGLAGADPVAIRGVLNATANFILSRMSEGRTYEEALAEATAAGLAERDPSADVEGHDSTAKLMILAALVFGRQLRTDQVVRRGIAETTLAHIEDAARRGGRIRELATLELRGPDRAAKVEARVEATVLGGDDLLARVEGTDNAIVCRTAPLGNVTIIGPGAGPHLAGQGVLSDLIAIAIAGTRSEGCRPK
jgi:homoserine dehydrogenase